MEEQAPTPSVAELLEACSVLFGGKVMCSVGFLRCLRPGGLRDAYRRRLMENHPDRAIILGQEPGDLHRRTVAIKAAYAVLHGAFRHGRVAVPTESAARPTQPTAPPRDPSPAAATGDNLFYRGQLPKRALRLGEYLYYRGVISWQALIQAICSQRRDRPRIGELALQLDYLAPEQILAIRHQQRPGEKFGATAVRLGYLSAGTVFVLLGRQRQLGRLFGEYIVEAGSLDAGHVPQLIDDHAQHNRRYGKR